MSLTCPKPVDISSSMILQRKTSRQLGPKPFCCSLTRLRLTKSKLWLWFSSISLKLGEWWIDIQHHPLAVVKGPRAMTWFLVATAKENSQCHLCSKHLKEAGKHGYLWQPQCRSRAAMQAASLHRCCPCNASNWTQGSFLSNASVPPGGIHTYYLSGQLRTSLLSHQEFSMLLASGPFVESIKIPQPSQQPTLRKLNIQITCLLPHQFYNLL